MASGITRKAIEKLAHAAPAANRSATSEPLRGGSPAGIAGIAEIAPLAGPFSCNSHNSGATPPPENGALLDTVAQPREDRGASAGIATWAPGHGGTAGCPEAAEQIP